MTEAGETVHRGRRMKGGCAGKERKGDCIAIVLEREREGGKYR